MSIDNINVIDFISLDKDENVVLTIVDELRWDSENTHLLKLQDKLNAYLTAIDNKSLYESYPQAKERKIKIRLDCKYFPNPDGEIFLQRVRNLLQSEGYLFEFVNLIKS